MKSKLCLILGFCSLVYCVKLTKPGVTDLWPTIYYNTEQKNSDYGTVDFSTGSPVRTLNETKLVPPTRKMYTFSNTSKEYQEGVFRAKLAKVSNCRPSYDKWDCEECKKLIPDGVVISSFSTFPEGTTGFIVISESSKIIHILIRGASSIRTKLKFTDDQLVPHPFIPNAFVRRGLLDATEDISGIVYTAVHDQMRLHPDYIVHVTGHSFGSAVGSLLIADMFHKIPEINSTNIRGYLLGKPRIGLFPYAQYFADNNLQIIRYVQGPDDIAHHPAILDGFVNEGDEYWITDNKLVACIGPYESRNCSNSLTQFTGIDHVNYFGYQQNCENDIYNIL